MNLRQWEMKAKVGKIFLVASETGLRGLYFKRQRVPMLKSLRDSGAVARILAQCVTELDEYFDGRRKKFELPLEYEGTEFQNRVWSELRKIPYGKTCSYQELAVRVKKHKAYRAVGTANGRNRLSIVIPCHRVINANGKLGGYGGGLVVKTRLLELEREFS
jgi:methylated-DNA-[protein]-cysteine S-methyltransferase